MDIDSEQIIEKVDKIMYEEKQKLKKKIKSIIKLSKELLIDKYIAA